MPSTRPSCVGALLALTLVGCSSDPAPVVVSTADPTADAGTPSRGATVPVPADPTSAAPAQGLLGSAPPVTTGGVTVRLTDVQAVQLTGQPAVRIVVVVRNGRREGVSLSGARVSLAHDGVTVVQDLSSTPVPAAVGAGETVQGTYVFALDADARDQVTVTVSAPGSGPLRFTGTAPVA